MAKYLLVGADPSGMTAAHPGGVLTLSSGLNDYAQRMGHELDVVDTFRAAMKPVAFGQKLTKGLARIRRVYAHLMSGSYSGVFIIAGAGLSFYERITMSFLCRLFRVKDAFIIVDGNFFSVRESAFVNRLLVRKLLRIPHRIISTGRNWDVLFAELGLPSQSRVTVHYWLPSNFPRREAAKPAPVGRALNILFVGWMIPEKGVPELIDAVSRLIGRHDLRLRLIGGGPLLDQVRATIVANSWEAHVVASGWVSPEELYEAYAQADLFVLPSHAEGFPMSLIEAFSSAVPAIVTDVGGVSETLEDGVNGFLIAPRSVEMLVDRLRIYLEDPSQLERHSAAALEAVRRNHNPDTNCRILFDAIDVPENLA